MEIKEGNLTFRFSEGVRAIKFDDCHFYRKKFNNLPGGRGVDFIADSTDWIQFIEVKDCSGHEVENVWRTSINNSRVSNDPNDPNGHFGEDSFDVEVAKKVASTITCLYGAWTKHKQSPAADELNPFWEAACSNKIPVVKKQVYVVLFLEGDFGANGPKSRSKKTIMKNIQDSIENKLSWLNCRVSVVDSTTYHDKLFQIG